VQYLSDGEINTISERCDNKSAVQTHVLVPVTKLASTLSNYQIVWLLFPVETELAFPLEFAGVHDTKAKQYVCVIREYERTCRPKL